MGVIGAVSPSSPWAVGLRDVHPWTLEALEAVKQKYEAHGLTWSVLEGTPSLEKTKLGLEGRDEEIDHFITLMQNMREIGLEIICHNWMPVISWGTYRL